MGKKSKAKGVKEKAAEAASGAAHAVEDGLDLAHRTLKRQLKERPAMVIGAAATLGLLIGALLTRRRD